MPRREAVAKAATPNPRPANWLLAVPVFGSFLPFERPGPAGCCAGACEWFNALEIEALSDKLAEVLALLLKDVLTETLLEAESLAVPVFDTLPAPLLVLAEAEPLPELLLALIDADTLLLKLTEVLVEVEASPEPLLVLVEPEPLPELLLALIDADTLLLKLVLAETDSLALIDAEVLSLNDTLTDLLSETDSLALTDSR